MSSDFTWRRIGQPISDRHFHYLLTLSLLTRIKTQLSEQTVRFDISSGPKLGRNLLWPMIYEADTMDPKQQLKSFTEFEKPKNIGIQPSNN